MGKILINVAIFAVLSPYASAQTSAPADPLVTRSGWEVGGQLSDYRYEEPSLGVKIWGGGMGVTGAYTHTGAGRWFFRADGRYGYGSLEYEGSGTKDSVPYSILETRGTFGKDIFRSDGISVSPFVGLGYRYLYNDLRGTSSTGAIGYRRVSNYWYAPLGVEILSNLVYAS